MGSRGHYRSRLASMRIFFLCLLLGLAATGWQPAAAQLNPPQYPLYDSTDSWSTARYLARAVAMNGLTDELLPAPVPWNTTLAGQRCYTGGALPDSAAYDFAAACAGRCSSAYCPANFRRDVAMLVELRASFVQYATSTWTNPEYFVPGSVFLQTARQTVNDINAAYDAAGFRRPLIQASVLESIDPGVVCGDSAGQRLCDPAGSWPLPGPPGTNSGANAVLIPAHVAAEFAAEMSPDEHRYYFDAAGHPRTDQHFNFFRIAYFFDTAFCPDISRIEARMWIYYQACCYLDTGYTALHMGQPKGWARLYNLDPNTMPAGLHRVAGLVAHIRSYAHRRPNIPFVFLTAEPMTYGPSGYRFNVKFVDGKTPDGQDRLIFDCNLAAMRPRELSPRLEARDNRGNLNNCPEIDSSAFARTPCAGQYLAVIDPCHGGNFAPDGGGSTTWNPAGTSRTPYVIYFDHGVAIMRDSLGRPKPTPRLSPGNGATWNWDDSAWFATALSDSCQATWLLYEMQQVRRFSESYGFLAIPGRLINDHYLGVMDYRLAAHPLVLSTLTKCWQVAEPQPVLTHTTARPRGRWYRWPRWQLRVTVPDVTSLYSWHLRHPDGHVELLGLGPTLDYSPRLQGHYVVYLRQHNWGLPAAAGGRRTCQLLPPAVQEAPRRRLLRRRPAPTPPYTTPVTQGQWFSGAEERRLLQPGSSGQTP